MRLDDWVTGCLVSWLLIAFVNRSFSMSSMPSVIETITW
jgi:hypothetical protein